MNSPPHIAQRSYAHPHTAFPASGLSSPRYGSPGPSSPGVRSSMDRNGCFAHVRMTAFAKLSRYMKRLTRFRHMDFEFACWQMMYLLVAPHKVYRNFMYRKKTKDQWARDDPAFVVLLSLTLVGSSVLYALILGLSLLKFVKFILWVIFIDFIGTGLVIASILWFISNQFMRRSGDPDGDVEWGYCWDVHLNSFFPLLVILHIIMPVLYPIIIGRSYFVSGLLGNGLWFIAIAYYIYITFLGYTALGNLKGTQIFLYPITFLFIGIIALTTLYVNISTGVMSFYHYRIT